MAEYRLNFSHFRITFNLVTKQFIAVNCFIFYVHLEQDCLEFTDMRILIYYSETPNIHPPKNH